MEGQGHRAGRAEEGGGGHLPGTVGVPVPLVGDVQSSPTARGRMLRLERKKQEERGWVAGGRAWRVMGRGTAPSERRRTCWEGGQEGTAPSDRRLTCQERESNPGHAMWQCTEIPLGHTASELHGGLGA